jgi:hypothetical protein
MDKKHTMMSALKIKRCMLASGSRAIERTVPETRIAYKAHSPGALATAEARVRAIVDADGKRLDAVVQVPTNGSQVRAVFTIYPPGSR